MNKLIRNIKKNIQDFLIDSAILLLTIFISLKYSIVFSIILVPIAEMIHDDVFDMIVRDRKIWFYILIIVYVIGGYLLWLMH